MYIALERLDSVPRQGVITQLVVAPWLGGATWLVEVTRQGVVHVWLG